MYPTIDFNTHDLISSQDQPLSIDQTLVLQISNLSGESILLQNNTGQEEFDFKPLSQAAPIEGLTMLYLVFPLGEKTGDFSTEELFSQITFMIPANLSYKKIGNDTIVIYPKMDITLEPMDLLEVLLKNVISFGSSGEMVLVDLTYFDMDCKVYLGKRPLFRTAPPLSIAEFCLTEDSHPSAFRDILTFSYCVLGADQCIFTPSDTTLPLRTTEGAGTPDTKTILYHPVTYALNAFHKENMVSRKLECIPKRASIVSFEGSTSVNSAGSRDVTLEIEVENTRHVYISRIGRIPVIPGTKNIYKLKAVKELPPFILSIENEDGLQEMAVVWK